MIENECNGKVVAMSLLREQDPLKTAAGYKTRKFPVVLSQVQAGDVGQCDRVYHNKNKRARR